jgi:hypothetical protein
VIWLPDHAFADRPERGDMPPKESPLPRRFPIPRAVPPIRALTGHPNSGLMRLMSQLLRAYEQPTFIGATMKLHYVATLFVTAAAGAAIAAAPAASAASAITSADTRPNSVETDTRPGNVEIQVAPPTVSDARSYGPFSSPAPFLGD